MGNSSLWSCLSCSNNSQISQRSGWLTPPDDLHTHVHPTGHLLVLTDVCTPAFASLTSTTVVLLQEDLRHARSRKTRLWKPCYVWANTCWASAVHPARMCGTLSWAWPHDLHLTSPGQLVSVFLLKYSFVGNSCSYIFNAPAIVYPGHDLSLLNELKHPFSHNCESDFLSISS